MIKQTGKREYKLITAEWGRVGENKQRPGGFQSSGLVIVVSG
jgi:hypothetical protein